MPSVFDMDLHTPATEVCWQFCCCNRTRRVSSGWPEAMPTMPLSAPAVQVKWGLDSKVVATPHAKLGSLQLLAESLLKLTTCKEILGCMPDADAL